MHLILGFGVLHLAQQKGKIRFGHTSWVLVDGKGPGEGASAELLAQSSPAGEGDQERTETERREGGRNGEEKMLGRTEEGEEMDRKIKSFFVREAAWEWRNLSDLCKKM